MRLFFPFDSLEIFSIMYTAGVDRSRAVVPWFDLSLERNIQETVEESAVGVFFAYFTDFPEADLAVEACSDHDWVRPQELN